MDWVSLLKPCLSLLISTYYFLLPFFFLICFKTFMWHTFLFCCFFLFTSSYCFFFLNFNEFKKSFKKGFLYLTNIRLQFVILLLNSMFCELIFLLFTILGLIIFFFILHKFFQRSLIMLCIFFRNMLWLEYFVILVLSWNPFHLIITYLWIFSCLSLHLYYRK